MPRTPGESLISRAARVLEAFDRDTESLSLSTLAHRAGLPIPTAHRLVTELVRYGLAGTHARYPTVSGSSSRMRAATRRHALRYLENGRPVLGVGRRDATSVTSLPDPRSAVSRERSRSQDRVAHLG